ncbi:hypothetical protein [Magnetospirillum molischianum]|uniref:Lipoprotein n=1 Tax=Magnetospirillum molischianum DSM 120 TaxID=1150626 RepID=H8FP35_MAGML|nr:hypothetical protein [Magnetospirillum molischianum]CCG40123.1 conserved exported hypothetical protein [Magnetospirillum molischianum DSM 120]
MRFFMVPIAAIFCFLVGCATPVSYSNTPLHTYDKDTEYEIEESPEGFSISIYYSRYQMVPESDAVATACKSQLTSIAWDEADRRGRKIELNEQRIRLSMGRNGLTGITSCQALGVARWAK